MSRVVIYEVTGMTCASCERVIRNVLQELPGVMDVEVSLKQQRAAIRLPEDVKSPEPSALNELVKDHSYRFYQKGQRPKTCDLPGAPDPFSKRLKRALLALAAVGLLAFILSPLRSAVPSVASGASVAAMVGLGFVASLSSCLATTGGFLLAYTSKQQSRFSLLAVHAGRLAAFAVGGAILGAIGGSIPQGSAVWYGILALALGIGFFFVGMNLLELTPSLAKMGIRLPSSFDRAATKVSGSTASYAPFLVGAATFILPCGFTQTAQALALASGSSREGFLLLVAFALGTLPVLLGVTWFGSAATLKHRALRLATGAALALVAIGQIDGGLTVLGSPITPSTILGSLTTRVATVEPIPAANAQEQVVKMTVAYGAYQPRNLRIKKGVPVRWEIDGQDVGGCASSIVVPTYRISRALTPGLNVITFTPTTAGTIPFSCGMGMIRGSFTVTE